MGALLKAIVIPSTLNGSCFDKETEQVDKEKLQADLEAAVDIYNNRVTGSPCGDTVIHLFRGADSSECQAYRQDLQIFFKGSKKKKIAEVEAYHLCLLP